MRLIPAIDLRTGRCVRLFQGDFGNETRYDATPQELMRRYRQMGADWLHIVDLDAARDSLPGCAPTANRAIVAALAAERCLELQLGGGLRDDTALAEVFELGVARAVIGSAAITQSREVISWLTRFGPERITLAFDVRLDAGGTPRVATHGWQRQSTVSLWDAVAAFDSSGLRHVLCTDVSRDGALSGPNFELYAEAARRFPNIIWQASGGVRDSADLQTLARCGAGAAISGKALLEGLIDIEDLQPFLPNA